MEGRTRRISRTGGGVALRALLALVLAIGLMPSVPTAFASEAVDRPEPSMEAQSLSQASDGGFIAETRGNSNSASGSNVAMVGEKGYATLSEAFANAPEGSTVVISGDFSTEEQIRLQDKSITLDLSGHTITSTVSKQFITLNGPNAGLTITDSSQGAAGKIVGTVADAFITVFQGTLDIQRATIELQGVWESGGSKWGNQAIYVLGSTDQNAINHSVVHVGEDATISSVDEKDGNTVNAGYAVSVNVSADYNPDCAYGVVVDFAGKTENAILYVNGSIKGVEGNVPTMSLSDTAVIDGGVYAAGYAAWNINGARIEGPTGMEIRAGVLNMTSGSITGTGTPTEVEPNGNGGTSVGAGLAIAQHTTKLPISVNISGGVISGYTGLLERNPQNNDEEAISKVDISVTGGTFEATNNGTNAVSSQNVKNFMAGGKVVGKIDGNCLVSGMKVNESGTVVINEEKAVAKVIATGAAYASLQEAIEAAPESGTVTLLKNIVLDATGVENNHAPLTITKDVVIDGGGHTVTAENVKVVDDAGPSMINVQDQAKVRFVDLVIDGKGRTKHGINMNDGACVELENVAIENNRWYAVVVNESSLDADGLQTSGNGWGINVDGADGESVLTISDSTIGEDSSIVLDGEKVKATVESGSYHYVVANEGASTIGLTVGGGTFDTDYKGYKDAVNIADHVADGLEWDPVTGAVEKPKPPVVEPSYDVTIAPAENGSVAVDPKAAKEGDKVTVTVKPDEGFELASLVVADEDGNALKLELSADGTYSFEMPAGDVTVHAAFECDGGELCPSHGFTDVDQSQWYHAAIDWAVDNDVLQGVGDGLMLPDGDITRAQMAQVLWNVEGQPAAAEGEGFSDVSEGDWFAGAVAWASQEGIFVGYDGAFDPDAELTREQAAAVLMRWAESNGEDVSGRADLSGFPDADGISEWAVESVRWAVDAGVLQGVANPDGTTTVSAQGTATRAQVAALMMRLEGQRTA